MRTERGFTLIELMLTITILAILLGVGVPAMSDLVRTNRRAAAVNAFVTAAQQARSTATTEALDTVFCHSTDGATCSGDASPDWSEGWIVFIDDNRNGSADSTDDNGAINVGEDVLLIGAPRSGVAMPSNRGSFAFNPGFQSVENTGTVGVCIDGNNNDRWIVIGPTGRSRLEKTATSGASC